MEFSYLPDPEPYRKCLNLSGRGEPFALATVIEAEGSTPQVAGSSAVVTAEGLAGGTVGGGRVEAETVAAAQTSLKRGRSKLLSFDLANDYSDEADAVCGGRMRILIDAAPSAHRAAFESLLSTVSRRGRGMLATFIEGKTSGVERRWFAASARSGFPGDIPWIRYPDEIGAGMAALKPIVFRKAEDRLYLEPHFPAARLAIAGAGHVGRAVARQGKLLGFETIVIDDRPELANGDRIPEADRFIVGDIAGSLTRLPLGREAFIVLVTRGHRHDAEALRACIRRRSAYLGMIGSGRKIALMRDDFMAKGWATPAQWARVHAPIGLPIGSKTVEEIAVSIVAELVAVRRGIIHVK
jgi:xanthine dehydrogenase accessory factor